jgi:cyanophycin synthetase
MTTTDGVHIGGRLTVRGDMTGPTSARMVLRDPAPTAAVLETARGGMLRAGLGFRRCDVGAVLNVAADHLGSKGVNTLEQLAEVKRLVVEVATDTAVLNADDDLCLEMANHTKARTICYVTMQEQHPLVREHVRSGGRAVVLEKGINGQMITILDHHRHIPLVWTHLVPATLEGRATHNVQNAMFAAAIAYSMDVDLETIRDGLRTFDASFFQTPGRTNLFSKHPFQVLLDYAHNPAAIASICATVDQFEVSGRRIVVLTAPGDRRNEDVEEVARIAARSFDHFILRTDDDRRGRGDQEIPKLQRETLLGLGIADSAIQIIPDERAAVDHALRMAHEGDFVTVFADNTTRSWKQVVHFGEDAEVAPKPPAEPTTDRPPLEPASEDSSVDTRLADATHEADESFVLGERTLVRDNRGVRVVIEHDD